VKASLIVSGKKVKKKKTSSQAATLTSAVWNEALTFTSLPRQQMDAAAGGARLELTLHHGHHGDALGKVTVGGDAGAEERQHWTDMLNGRPAVAKWHELKPASDTRQHKRNHDSH